MSSLNKSDLNIDNLNNNSLMHICYNCNYMRDIEMKKSLSQFLLKGCNSA